jgi:hypothetical protein
MNELPAPAAGAAWLFDFDRTFIQITHPPGRAVPSGGHAARALPCAGVHAAERGGLQRRAAVNGLRPCDVISQGEET